MFGLLGWLLNTLYASSKSVFIYSVPNSLHGVEKMRPLKSLQRA